MSKSKTPLFAFLKRCFSKAKLSNDHPEMDTNSLVDLDKVPLEERRKFLKNTARSMAALGVSLVMPDWIKNKSNGYDFSHKLHQYLAQPEIAIIGGGIAGLNCAWQLKKKGITSTVYEADKRTGGRIYTQYDQFGKGLFTEFGGEFIDSTHKDMFGLAEEFGLTFMDTAVCGKEDGLSREFFWFGNRQITEHEVIEQFKQIADHIQKDKESVDENLENNTAGVLDRMTLEEYVSSLKCNEWMCQLITSAYEGEYGLDAKDQSALNFIMQINTDTSEGFKLLGDSDERYKVKGGNSLIPETLKEKVSDQIISSAKLTAIIRTGNRYRLVFDGHKEVSVDLIVIAVPFTALRNVDIQVPEMTPQKRACINNLGYGQNNKLILGVKKRIWRTSRKNEGFLFNPTVQNGWDSSQCQNDNKGKGSYTVLLGGSASLKLAQSVTDGKVHPSTLAPYVAELSTIYPGFKRAFNDTVKTALWTNHPFIRASYACYRPGQWTTLAGLEAAPVGNILFAGEHCSNEFQGFMNGAAETGRMAAESILARL